MGPLWESPEWWAGYLTGLIGGAFAMICYRWQRNRQAARMEAGRGDQ